MRLDGTSLQEDSGCGGCCCFFFRIHSCLPSQVKKDSTLSVVERRSILFFRASYLLIRKFTSKMSNSTTSGELLRKFGTAQTRGSDSWLGSGSERTSRSKCFLLRGRSSQPSRASSSTEFIRVINIIFLSCFIINAARSCFPSARRIPLRSFICAG